MSKKPTGNIGPIVIRAGQKIEWETIKFSKNKREIENIILGKFKNAGEKAGFKFHDIKNNPENDFDYTLQLPGGEVFLDLMEIIYQNPHITNQESPYKEESIWIKSKDYADQIIDGVMKKNKKYQSKSVVPIHLLIYVTHWSFDISENVIRLCQHRLAKEAHIFENIFFLKILDEQESQLRVLYPICKTTLNNVDFKRLEDHSYLCANPAKWFIASNK